jgi:hypothetical protein
MISPKRNLSADELVPLAVNDPEIAFRGERHAPRRAATRAAPR